MQFLCACALLALWETDARRAIADFKVGYLPLIHAALACLICIVDL